jgi:hypothetical protein
MSLKVLGSSELFATIAARGHGETIERQGSRLRTKETILIWEKTEDEREVKSPKKY